MKLNARATRVSTIWMCRKFALTGTGRPPPQSIDAHGPRRPAASGARPRPCGRPEIRFSDRVRSLGSPVIKEADTVGDFQQFVADVTTRLSAMSKGELYVV